MPIRWNIDHARHLIEIFAEGESGPQDLVRLLDAIEAEKAVSYRKLFDATEVSAPMDGRAMIPLAERISALRRAGPFAVIVPSAGRADGIARLFLLLADAQDRARVFRNRDEARTWLESMPVPPPET